MRGVQTPTKSSIPEWRENHWQDVVELCSAYGLDLDPWQQNVIKAASGEDAFGNWSATRVGLSVPRQCGKTALFEARELAGLLLYGEQLIMHSAHLLPTALEGFERIKGYFENYDDLSKKVRRIRVGNGDQAIELLSGQRLMFKARASTGSGRGFSPDCLMLDEAQILNRRQWSSLFPSMSARENPQAWLAGTPPTDDDDAEAFTAIRDSALAGRDKRSAWLEWTMEEGDRLDDKKVWAKAIPALGGRIQVATVEDERNSMSDEQFATERLGLWRSAQELAVIQPEDWAAQAVDGAPEDYQISAIGLDMNLERTVVSVAIAVRDDEGKTHVELASLSATEMFSTDALVAWIVKRAKRRIPVIMDGFSPVRSLEPILRAERVTTRALSANELMQACGGFYDGVVKDKSLTHFDQDQLNASLAGGKRQNVGDAGGWKWSRKSLDVDLTPIMAATCAHYGAVKFGRPRKIAASHGGSVVVC